MRPGCFRSIENRRANDISFDRRNIVGYRDGESFLKQQSGTFFWYGFGEGCAG